MKTKRTINVQHLEIENRSRVRSPFCAPFLIKPINGAQEKRAHLHSFDLSLVLNENESEK